MRSYLELIVSLIGLVVGIIGLATYLSGLTNDGQVWRVTILLAYLAFAGGIIYFAIKGKNASQRLRLLSLGVLYVLTILFSFGSVVGQSQPRNNLLIHVRCMESR